MYEMIQKLILDLIKKIEGKEMKPPWFNRIDSIIKSNLIINSVNGFFMPFFNRESNPVLILVQPSLNLYYSQYRGPPKHFVVLRMTLCYSVVMLLFLFYNVLIVIPDLIRNL